MTHEQRDALQGVLDSLSQFAFGPIGPDTPYVGQVSLTARQYDSLLKLMNP